MGEKGEAIMEYWGQYDVVTTIIMWTTVVFAVNIPIFYAVAAVFGIKEIIRKLNMNAVEEYKRLNKGGD